MSKVGPSHVDPPEAGERRVGDDSASQDTAPSNSQALAHNSPTTVDILPPERSKGEIRALAHHRRSIAVDVSRAALWTFLDQSLADADRKPRLAMRPVDAGPKLRLSGRASDPTWRLSLVDARGTTLAHADLNPLDLGPARTQIDIELHAARAFGPRQIAVAMGAGLMFAGIAAILSPFAALPSALVCGASVFGLQLYGPGLREQGRGNARVRIRHLYRRLYRALTELQSGHGNETPFRQIGAPSRRALGLKRS